MADYSEKRTAGKVTYYRDWDCDGAIRMVNPKTIDIYKSLRYRQPNADEYGVFFAFSEDRFNEGYNHLIELGLIKDGEKVVRSSRIPEMFCANKELLKKWWQFYYDNDKEISEKCNPQEVYFYEYNNHEAMINYEGDLEPIKIVASLFGREVAKKITRYSNYYSLDEALEN